MLPANKREKYGILFFSTLLLISLIFCPVNVYSESSVSKSDATDSLRKSLNTVNYLKSIGVPAERFEDIYSDAKISFDSGDYKNTINDGNEIQYLKEFAISLSERFESVKLSVEIMRESYYDITDLEKTLPEAEKEYIDSNFEVASEILASAEEEIELFYQSEVENMMNIMKSINSSIKKNNLTINIHEEINSELFSILDSETRTELSLLKNEISLLNITIYNIITVKNFLSDNKFEIVDKEVFIDPYEEALLLLEFRKFERANVQLDNIFSIAEEIDSLLSLAGQAEKLISDFKEDGLDMSSAEDELIAGITLLSENEYEESREKIQNSIETAEKIRDDSLLFGTISKRNINLSILSFINENWHLILIVLLLLLIFYLFFYYHISKKIFELRLGNLKKEESVITELIKKYQYDYFKKKKISRETYNNAVDKYQERLIKIKELMPVVKCRIEKCSKKMNKKVYRKVNKH